MPDTRPTAAAVDQSTRDRIAEALAEARRPGLGSMTEAEAVTYMADAVLAVLPPPADRAAVLAEVLPAWEAVYEPGNVSDYLIGYANDQDAATGMAEAWMRSQAEVTGRLEWVSEERMATDRYDRWFELIERHGDGIDTGPGIVVRRRLADETQRPAVGARQPDTETPKPVSPAYARLQAAAHKATEAAHLHAMHGMKRTFQLALRYGNQPIPAAEVLNALGLDQNANTVEPAAPAPVPDPTWPRRAWDLGLLHKGGDPHHCPACVAQPEPPKDFICPGAEANAEVLANPQPAATSAVPGRSAADTEAHVAPHCNGFPTTCPNPVTVPPAPPHHYGGIRCGCYDEEA